MTTSGSYNFTASRDQIINRALRKLGVVAQGDTASYDQIAEGAEALNAMIKEWQTEHVHLWTYEWETQVFTAASEVTGTDGSIYTCVRGHTSAAANRPVTGANYSTFWVLRGSTGGVWSSGVSYTATGDFAVAADTLGIEQAFIRGSEVDSPLAMGPLAGYLALPNKAVAGVPTMMVLHRGGSPTVFLYPQPEDTDMVLHYLRIRKLEDFDSGANTPDFPDAWISALVWGLAAELGPEYNAPVEKQRTLDRKAEELKTRAKTDDTESFDSIHFQPGR